MRVENIYSITTTNRGTTWYDGAHRGDLGDQDSSSSSFLIFYVTGMGRNESEAEYGACELS